VGRASTAKRAAKKPCAAVKMKRLKSMKAKRMAAKRFLRSGGFDVVSSDLGVGVSFGKGLAFGTQSSQDGMNGNKLVTCSDSRVVSCSNS